MYLTIDDITTGIYEETLNALTRKPADVDQAIKEAVDEVRGYLSARYDANLEFNKSGSARSNRVVQLTRDIAIYNCYKLSNPANMPDIRIQVYKDAVKSLTRIQAEQESVPGLVRLQAASGGSNYVSYGGNKRRRNNG